MRCKTRLPLKKTDKSKQWDVLEKSILSVKAAEKRVDCFYDLVGCLCFLLSISVASSHSGTYRDTLYKEGDSAQLSGCLGPRKYGQTPSGTEVPSGHATKHLCHRKQ